MAEVTFPLWHQLFHIRLGRCQTYAQTVLQRLVWQLVPLVCFYRVHLGERSLAGVGWTEHGEHIHSQCLQCAIVLGARHPKCAQAFSTTESSLHVSCGLDFSQFALNGRLVQRHHFHHMCGEFSAWADGEWVMHKSNDMSSSCLLRCFLPPSSVCWSAAASLTTNLRGRDQVCSQRHQVFPPNPPLIFLFPAAGD